MFRDTIVITVALCFVLQVSAQYAPPAGQQGTTAINADSNIFVFWANYCNVNRGWKDIADTTLGKVTYGTESNAFAKADNSVVSLGDGGQAVLSFAYPIVDGPGFDFAVFENALNDSFLELAFVEVSSDSIHFVRFPSVSYSDTTVQIGTFGSVDATKIHNLAGKYRYLYGTPFDLNELQDTPQLDINNVRYVRIIDAIGTIDDSLCTYDSQGNKINDPYPTAFETGGFDLDAVGVIHSEYQGASSLPNEYNISVFPNPVSCNGKLFIYFQHFAFPKVFRVQIFNNFGQLIVSSNQQIINLNHWKKGVYIVNITVDELFFYKKIVVF